MHGDKVAPERGELAGKSGGDVFPWRQWRFRFVTLSSSDASVVER